MLDRALSRARWCDPLGAAVAGAGVDRHRGRAVPGAVLARAVAVAAADRPRHRSRRVLPDRAPPRCCRCCCVRLPSRTEKLRRLDRNSGLPHRPATTISDEIAGETDDVHAVALWRAHIERALRSAKTLRAGLPMPRVAARDPMALRALVLMLVIATFFVAGGDRMQARAGGLRLAGRDRAGEFPHRRLGQPADLYRQAAADPAGPAAGRAGAGRERADRGAGRQHAGHPRQRPGQSRRRRPPAGSPSRKPTAQPAANRGADRAALRHQRRRHAPRCALSSDVTWQFTAIPDRPPTIALTGEPQATPNGLQMSYKLEDDYGVVGAQATFKLHDAPRHQRPPAAHSLRGAGIPALAAAGAHPQRRRPHHQGPDRASLGRRRRVDDADRARRRRQRRRHRADRVPAAGARRSPIRSRAR